jgi:DnaA family protein
MKQLVLNLRAEQAQTFEHFVVGQNAELVHRLNDIASGNANDAIQDHFVYMWGGSAAGKSHLLHAVMDATSSDCARFINADSSLDAFEYTPQIAYYLLDDCDRLSASAQIAAFNLFNQIREQGGYLISTGALPPAQLALREDLRTRLGWGLIYQLVELTDEEKIAALTQIADTRGMTLAPGILPYLLTHYRRDMPSLSHVLDALDQYSLETKRPVTLPLLRDLLQQEAQNNS